MNISSIIFLVVGGLTALGSKGDGMKSENGYVKEMSIAEMAYVAGAIDGEGTVGLYRQSSDAVRCGVRYNPSVGIYNTNTTMLEFCRNATGMGSIVVNNKKTPGHKQGFELHFKTSEIRKLLPSLIPYLVIKKQQAELVMEYFAIMDAKTQVSNVPGVVSEYERIATALNNLNRKGDDGPGVPREILVRQFAKPISMYGERKCLVCELVYQAVKNHQRYCSLKCKKKADYQVSRDSYLARSAERYAKLKDVINAERKVKYAAAKTQEV